MQLYQPNLLLVRNVSDDNNNGNDDFILFATTYCDRLNIRHQEAVVPTQLDENGILNIELNAVQDISLSQEIVDVQALVPIVHVINLGSSLLNVPSPSGNGQSQNDMTEIMQTIKATFWINHPTNTALKRPGGSSTVKKVVAGGHTRPAPANKN